jgi:hypothetical protein
VIHLLNLLAAIALLVWGTHIVRTGMLRVLGEDLRQVLAAASQPLQGRCCRAGGHQPGAKQHRHMPDRGLVRRLGSGGHHRRHWP